MGKQGQHERVELTHWEHGMDGVTERYNMQAIRQIIDDAPASLTVPENLRHHKLEVIYLVIEEPASQRHAKGWPIGAFDRMAGGWQGESLIREPQGEFERRLELE